MAAILSLVQLMEVSTASTVTGLATELTFARQLLVDKQASLGVRAGCQLWERFFALSGGVEVSDVSGLNESRRLHHERLSMLTVTIGISSLQAIPYLSRPIILRHNSSSMPREDSYSCRRLPSR